MFYMYNILFQNKWRVGVHLTIVEKSFVFCLKFFANNLAFSSMFNFITKNINIKDTKKYIF